MTNFIGPTVWVVEGTDGVGKSTFAQKFAETSRNAGVKAHIVHNGPPGDITKLYDLYKLQIDRAIERRDRDGETTIIDRSFLSEFVYGKHRPGGSKISARQVKRLERYCKRHDVILLGVEASLSTRKERLKARGEPWSYINAFTGAQMGHHFRTFNKFWILADSPSATASNESN